MAMAMAMAIAMAMAMTMIFPLTRSKKDVVYWTSIFSVVFKKIFFVAGVNNGNKRRLRFPRVDHLLVTFRC